MLGQVGCGKTSLISQFITSEYRNAFADDVEATDTTVSISIGGAEVELVFIESDSTNVSNLLTFYKSLLFNFKHS